MHRQSATELIATALYAASEFTVGAVILAAIVLSLAVATHGSNDGPSGQVGLTAPRAAASVVANGRTPYVGDQGQSAGEFGR